jgi:hypothetical protein
MDLSYFDTLEFAKAYEEDRKRMIPRKTMAMNLDAVGLYLIVHDIATGKLDGEAAHPAKPSCLLIANTLADSSSDDNDFNFMQGNFKGDAVIAKTIEMRDSTLSEYSGEIQSLLDICTNYCNYKTKPYAESTLTQFNAAKGYFSSQPIEFKSGKDIVVTLNDNLSEKVAATVWRTELGFSAENAGRNAHMQLANKYRIDMSGKKSGNYEVRVPLLGVDFSVELI